MVQLDLFDEEKNEKIKHYGRDAFSNLADSDTATAYVAREKQPDSNSSKTNSNNGSKKNISIGKSKKSDSIADQMFEFLKNNLAHSDTYDAISRKRLHEKGYNHFMRSDDLSTVIFLMPERLSGDYFKKVQSHLNKTCYDNVVFLPVKNGKAYFRTASFPEVDNLKSITGKKDRSLKNYSFEDLKRVIIPTPAELAIMKQRNNEIIYFQPESQRLEEKLVKQKFSPLVYDYSHLPVEERPLGQVKKESTKRFLWLPNQREEHSSGIYFKRNKIHSLYE